MKRLAYLDALRCCAIVFIVLLHCMTAIITNADLYGTASWQGCVILNAFCRTGVPIFFMISGFLILRNDGTRDVASFYRKRMPRLLIPLLVWNVIYFLFNALLGKGLDVSGFLRALINNGNSYHMWFVYTLMGLYLTAPFIKRIADNCSQRELAVFLLILVFPGTIRPFINTVTPVYLNLFAPLAEGYMGYFILGYLLGTVDWKPYQRNIIYGGGLAGFLLGVAGNIIASSSDGINLISNGGYSINHYLLSGAIFVFFRYAIGGLAERLTRARMIIRHFSDISFGVYWIHALVHTSLLRFWSPDASPVFVVAYQFVMVFSISSLLITLLSKIGFFRRYLL